MDKEKEVTIFAVIVCMIGMVLICISYLDPNYTDKEICSAIYRTEGGDNAKFLYGIRSVRYADAKEAREICIRTISNNRQRWVKAGKRGDFLQYLSATYCPVNASNDPRGLNKAWLKNVHYFLGRGDR